jgi:branched-chain amino acid transport system substrate-binding protein
MRAAGGSSMRACRSGWPRTTSRSRAGPVELLRRDVPGSAPEQARRHAQELVENERVDLLAGLDFSSNAYAVGTVAAQAKLPLVVMNAASSGITARCPYAVRLSFTIAQVTLPLARWALQQGLRDVCTVVADYASGVDAESAFVAGITAGGGRVGAMLRVPLNTLDYSAYMLRLRELKPQAVFFFLPSGQMPATFLKFWRDRGMADTGIRLLATGDATDDHYLEGIGELADGLVTSHHYSFAHESPANRRFTGVFETEYGSHLRPGYFAVAAHDALAAIDAAMSSPSARGSLERGAAGRCLPRPEVREPARSDRDRRPHARHRADRLHPPHRAARGALGQPGVRALRAGARPGRLSPEPVFTAAVRSPASRGRPLSSIAT